MDITPTEIQRYSRHLLLPDFSAKEQEKLKRSRVLIVGAGGLGNPVAQYLAAAGVGNITLMDDDIIELSNLPRQVLFAEQDLGQPKVSVMASRLRHLNSNVSINALPIAFDQGNADVLCRNHNLIIDCCDRISAKYRIDDACRRNGRPLIFGAVSRFEGQVALFHGTAGIGYSDVYPQSSLNGNIGNCETLGVWGASAGIIGCIMASEAIQWISFRKSTLDGRLLQADLRNYSFHSFELKQRVEEKNLIRYNDIIQDADAATFMAIIKEPQVKVIDVREHHEHDAFHLGGVCIPLNDLRMHSAAPEDQTTMLLYCSSGIRSYQAALLLAELGYKNIITLRGGIEDIRHDSNGSIPSMT
jgi:adenylyltransferase/sulfurtransferase